MKIMEHGLYKFVCNYCGNVAGMSYDEQDALVMAREVANQRKWEWKHPHWFLICPDCKGNQDLRNKFE